MERGVTQRNAIVVAETQGATKAKAVGMARWNAAGESVRLDELLALLDIAATYDIAAARA